MPVVAIAHEYFMRRAYIRQRIIGRIPGLRRTRPGTRIEDLEDACGMTATNRGGIIGTRIQARLAFRDFQGALRIRSKDLHDHGSYRRLTWRWTCGRWIYMYRWACRYRCRIHSYRARCRRWFWLDFRGLLRLWLNRIGLP